MEPQARRLANRRARGPTQITKRLPEADGEFQYAIKSAFEDHERVVFESDLTRAL